MNNAGRIVNPPLSSDPARAALVCRLNALGWLIEEAKLLGEPTDELIAESQRIASEIDGFRA